MTGNLTRGLGRACLLGRFSSETWETPRGSVLAGQLATVKPKTRCGTGGSHRGRSGLEIRRLRSLPTAIQVEEGLRIKERKEEEEG